MIADLGEQDIARVDAEGGPRVPSLRPDSMVRQMRADVGAGYMPAVVPVHAEDDWCRRGPGSDNQSAHGGRRTPSGRLSQLPPSRHLPCPFIVLSLRHGERGTAGQGRGDQGRGEYTAG